MSVVVTGATGQLGRLVVAELLARDVPPGSIVATGRNIASLADLAEQGVDVRGADFDDPATLGPAFAGAQALLLVSAPEVGKRIPQHTAAAEAAREAGIGVIVYTSILHADASPLVALAAEHTASERAIAATGLPHVFLRNSWYVENYLGQLPTYLAHGIAGAAGDGRISAATRADYAAAAATVLIAALEGRDLPAPGAAGSGTVSPTATETVYELGGEAFTLAELAATITKVSGTEVGYTDLPEDAYAQLLVDAGLPEGFARVLAGSDTGAKAGGLFTDSGDLERLAGRPLTSLEDAVRAAL